MKTFKSGELAEILNVTIQSISNYRREGMPYHSFDGVGYRYSFTAIKWFCMFKSQDRYENKRYKAYRKAIQSLQKKNQELFEVYISPYATAEDKEVFKRGIKINKEKILRYLSRL
jgi:phage terminase Nu1 subunit (DNA packaging protein)